MSKSETVAEVKERHKKELKEAQLREVQERVQLREQENAVVRASLEPLFPDATIVSTLKWLLEVASRSEGMVEEQKELLSRSHSQLTEFQK